MIRKIFCPILRHSLIVGCSSTTTSGIDVYLAQGDNTNVWADIYITVTLQFTQVQT